MNVKINYQKELEKLIDSFKDGEKVPTLILHSCCAPCSSYVLEYLSEFFKITVFYYNPNIYPETEYNYRVQEQKNLVSNLKTKYPIEFRQGVYDKENFYSLSKGLENIPEGGERCFKCYELRLRETGKYALENGFDYFTTTLTISPHKNSQKLNDIGGKVADELGIKYLYSDFKKKNGYRRSVELSNSYGLYRQDYCGCIFSKMEADKRRGESDEQK